MTLWVFFGLMSVVAVGFAVWPLYKRQQKLSSLIGFAVIFVVALSSGLYYQQGSPDLPSGSSNELQSMDDAVAALAARLAENPDDPAGWKMLGRSYMSLGNFPGAVQAYEKAVELESARDPQALVGLGEALMAQSNSPIDGRIASLFENALALDPNNPQALFYGGIAAFNRNDQSLAADRWERLLALNPPAEIQDILRQRVAEWRGEAPPMAGHPPIPAAEPEEAPAAAASGPISDGAVVRANLSLSAAARADLPAEAIVFVIARDPAQPMPPIAVTRRKLSELPTLVELGDRESMVPGRDLSGFAEFELIARVSVSGQPNQQPGDWFGTVIVTPADNNDVMLAIQERVN